MAVPHRGATVLVILSTVICAGCGDDACPPGSRPVGAACQPIDDCAGAPCDHGTCVDRVDAFECQCAPGYTGTTCADDVDECAAATHDCAPGARCTDVDGGFTCACPAGTTGDGRACSPCPAGTWGDECSQTCGPGHCVGPITCHPADGSERRCTSCTAGHTGLDCDGACDPTGCRDGAVTCAQDGGWRTCTAGCVEGRWGPGCDAICVAGSCEGPASCDQATGQVTACTGCHAGWWGPGCEQACPQGACVGPVSCDQATGAPIACQTCAPGAWGPTCASACTQGPCVGAVTCDRFTGAPLACGGCAPGSWGPICADACAQGSCVGVVTCDQASGTAVACAACTAGAWGPTCADACAQGNCIGAVTCDPGTGTVTACGACTAGAWGRTCANACAQGDCVGAVTCDQTWGGATACAACIAGAWGPTCAEACAQGDCTGDVTCDQASGTVTACGACVTGAWGPTCAQACAQGGCVGAATCDQGSGTITACDACPAGAWGPTCDDACPPGHCTGTVTCDQTSGEIFHCEGCANGWFGGDCTRDWWDLAWPRRAPIAFDTSASPPGADHVQVPVDVDALCYGTRLPPILYSYHFEQPLTDRHIESRDGHGGFAPLDHGGLFMNVGHGHGLHLADVLAEWVDLPDIVPGTHTITVTAWVRADDPSNGVGVLQAWGTAGVPGGEVYLLSMVDGDQCSPPAGPGVYFMAKVHPVGYAEHAACSTTTVESLRTYFVAMTYDRRFERLWIDGVEERRHDYGPGLGTLEASSAVRLGVDRGFNHFFHGVLDDVTVFDGVVDDTDVAALMAPACRRDLADLRFYDATTDTLLPYWIESDRRVWVRVPVDASSHDVAVYHGRVDAPAVSDGEATFELFDDFADGIDPAAWISGCASPPAGVHGRLRATGTCEGIINTTAFGDRRLVAAIDVHRAGPSHQACADARLGWSTANLFGALRFDAGDLDALGVGTGPATCAGAASVPGATYDLGTLELGQAATGDDWLARYQPVHGAGVTASRAGVPGIKGALQLALSGHADTPRYLDNLRVWVPSTTTVDVGLPCTTDGICAGYRWVNLGPRTESMEIAPTCTGAAEVGAVCDADNLGRRVHIDSAGAAGVTLRSVGAGSSAFGVTVPDGAGSQSSLSPDERTLTWTGRTTCTNHATAMVALEEIWECQRGP